MHITLGRCKDLSVNEDYFWTGRSFDVELFEFSVPAMLHNCFGYSVLNVGPGSNFTASLLRKILKTLQYWVTQTKTIVEGTFQIFINNWKSNLIFNDLHPLSCLYKFFIMSTEFDTNISEWRYECTDYKNDFDVFFRLVKWPKIAVKKSQII